MKPCHSLIIIVLLILSAALSSIRSYRCTEDDILQDMNRALVITLHETQDQWITPDTIRSYRANLKMEGLRERSIVSYVVREDDRRGKNMTDGMLTTRMMSLRGNRVQGMVHCSMLDILGMSNLRLPVGLSLLAAMWAMVSVLYFRRDHPVATVPSMGDFCYDAQTDTFYNARREEVKFTPMQHQLMQMFWQSDRRVLTKQEICDRLWPKKPDASETLYTLIRRIKPIIESNSMLKIESDRGRSYRLVNQ